MLFENATALGFGAFFKEDNNMKKIRVVLLFVMLMVGTLLFTGNDSSAAVKLSAKKITFSKPSKGSKTIIIKGVKASKIKKLTVTSGNNMIAKVTKKGKNKFVIKAKYAGETSVSVNAEFKKPVNGAYSFYGYLAVKVKGTSKIPVKTVKDLTGLMEYNDKWTYVLKNDIDLSGVSLPLKNKWKQNLSLSNTTLDGDGHVIKNLNGPFIQNLGGTLKNIRFENFKIDCKNTDKTPLRDCISKGEAAALIQNTSMGTIKNCKVSGSIKLTFTGGDNFDSKDDGRVYYLKYVGGLVGRNQSNAVIEKCVSDVDITLDYRESEDASRLVHVGGICGENVGSDYKNNPMKECMNTGDIITYNSNSFVGGIAGMSGHAEYTDCANYGMIKNDDKDRTNIYGGLVGWGAKSDILKNCLNAGKVGYGIEGYVKNVDSDFSAYENVYNAEDKTVYLFNYLTDPFEVPGVHNVSGSDMTNEAEFAGFDFDKIWKMGSEYPVLKNVY